LHCHPEPFGCAQDRLREGSVPTPLPFARADPSSLRSSGRQGTAPSPFCCLPECSEGSPLVVQSIALQRSFVAPLLRMTGGTVLTVIGGDSPHGDRGATFLKLTGGGHFSG